MMDGDRKYRGVCRESLLVKEVNGVRAAVCVVVLGIPAHLREGVSGGMQ